MRIGILDRRVKLQRPPTAEEIDTAGQPLDGWVTIATVWAGVDFVSGAEAFKADQDAPKQAVVFEVRFRRDVRPAMRVIHDGNVYQVEDVAEVGRRDRLRLTCFAMSAVPGGTA